MNGCDQEPVPLTMAKAIMADSGQKAPPQSGFKMTLILGPAGAMLIALMGLLGYVPGLRLLGSIRPDYIPMAPSTAASFLILGAALLLHNRKLRTWPGWKFIEALVVLATLFSALTVAGNLAGLDLNFENWLPATSGTLGGIPIGRMSPLTGAVFMLAGLGTLLLLLARKKSAIPRYLGHCASGLGVLTVLGGSTVLLAYLYGSPLMYSGTTVPMAATTAIAFVFLGSAVAAAAGPESLPLRLVCGDSTSARLSRVFFPLTVTVVILQGLLSHMLSASIAIHNALFLAFLAIAAGTLFVAVIVRVAHSLGRSLDMATEMLRQSGAYGEMARRILQILNGPGDLQQAIQPVLTVLKAGTGFAAVGMRLQEGEDFPYIAQQGFSPDFLRTENTLLARGADGGMCRDSNGAISLECTCGLVLSGKAAADNPLFTTGGSFWTNDSRSLLDIPPDQEPRLHPRNQCIHQGYASVALVPIRMKERIVGLLQFNDRRKGRFSLAAVEQLENIAAHIGEALMRKRAEQELQQNEARLKKMVDILQHQSTTIQDFLDYALEQALQLTGSKIGYIYHYNDVRREFILNSWSREVMAECAVANPLTCYELAKTGIWGEAVRQRRPIVVNDFQAAHPLKKGYPQGHVHLLKFMTVPIFRDERIVGVVGLANKQGDYDETDILQVSLLMEAIWKVTDRMRSEDETKRQLAEKEILLKEVHHRIKNNIASISGLLSLRLQSTSNTEAIDVLQDAIGRMDSMRILYDKLLLGKGYEDISVKNYAESLADGIVALFPGSAKVTVEKDIVDFHLDAKRLFPLGLIINELITNKMKYAFPNRDSGRIRISLVLIDNRARLVIQDDGVGLPDGFDPETSQGFGLILVKMLSQQLGGSFTMETQAGARCLVEFDV